MPTRFFLDDFESAPGQNQFGGYWFTYADDIGTVVAPDPNGDIVYALGGSPVTPDHSFRFSGVFGTPLTNTQAAYAGFGCTLRSDGQCLDLSIFHGIRFYCRSPLNTKVSFVLKKQSIVQPNADFYYEFQAPAEWQEISIPFSQLSRPPEVQPLDLVLNDVLSVQWVPAKQPKEFDFRIDDVKFY